jgi:hypothetical protein
VASPEDVKKESAAELVSWGLSIEKGLTDWEIKFLEDMNKRIKGEERLSVGMRNKLEQIIVEKG